MTGATITTNKIILFTVWFFILGQKSSFKGGPRPVQRQSVFGIRGRKTSFKCLPLSDRDDRHFIVVDDYIWIFQMKMNWGSTHDKSKNNILCWNVHEKTNHSVLAHLWCAMEMSWFSQLAKYITQRNKVMSWWEPQLRLFVCLLAWIHIFSCFDAVNLNHII